MPYQTSCPTARAYPDWSAGRRTRGRRAARLSADQVAVLSIAAVLGVSRAAIYRGLRAGVPDTTVTEELA